MRITQAGDEQDAATASEIMLHKPSYPLRFMMCFSRIEAPVIRFDIQNRCAIDRIQSLDADPIGL